ncbi:hypothetical protein Tco_1265688 [Tanacetum coccineum]
METKDTLSSCSNLEEQQMQQIQDKAKKSCMVSFRKLHSHLKHLSHDNLKGTRIESGFKRAFATLFGQDVETFIGTMFLNMDQLEKQLDKEEFQEIGSIASFKVLETQFQMFIKSRIYLDDEYVDMIQFRKDKCKKTTAGQGIYGDADDADNRDPYMTRANGLSEPPHVQISGIPNIMNANKALDVSAGTSNLSAVTSPRSTKARKCFLKLADDSNNVRMSWNAVISDVQLNYSMELLDVVSKSSPVHAADNPIKRQQHNTTHTSTTTDVAGITSIEHSFHTANSNSKWRTKTSGEKQRWRDVYVSHIYRESNRTKEHQEEAGCLIHAMDLNQSEEELHAGLID